MSYLVDALKKAERERRAHEAQEIHALSAGGASVALAPRAGPWLWLVSVLVASNVALAIYVWRPRPAEPVSSPPPIATRLALADAKRPIGLAPGSSTPQKRIKPAAESSPSEPQSATQALSHRQQRTTQHTSSAATPSSTTSAGDNDAASPPSAADTRSQRGRVTYSKVPLTDNATPVDSAAARGANYSRDEPSAPDQSEMDDAPSVRINGQLYSTVPGRSFILVNGRRYHEGERLAAGPAVESIEPSGAMLRYHGQRYHVAGPG